jgi:hypothetical protein
MGLMLMYISASRFGPSWLDGNLNVCMYVCMYACLPFLTSLSMYAFVSVRVCVSVSVRVCVCVCVCMHIYVCIKMYVCVCIVYMRDSIYIVRDSIYT